MPVATRQPSAVLLAGIADVGLGVGGAAAAAAAVAGVAAVPLPVFSDYGLVAELPPLFWGGLFGLNVMLGLALWRRRHALTAAMLVLLVGIVYGAASVVDRYPRLEVSWRHLGIADVILRTGHVDPLVDAYFNWPGFFAGLAGFMHATGVNGTSVALVAPVLNGLLWSVGVAAIVRALTPDLRVVWLTVWLFTLTDWIDQDYLSPQALTYFFYLVAVALALRYLDASPVRTLRGAITERGRVHGFLAWWRSRQPVEAVPRQRVVAVLLVVMLGAASIVAHQLTPVMLLGGMLGLALVGRLWAPRLTVVLGLMLVLWFLTGASTYLAGHPVLFQQGVGSAAASTLRERVAGSPGHMVVVQMRTAVSAALLAVAAIGALRMRRLRLLDRRALVLLVVPFSMLPLQSYGGEMIMRATLFSLPFSAYFAAEALLHAGEPVGDGSQPRRARRRSWQPLRLVAVITLSALFSVGVVTGRYGNMAFDAFTSAEVRGVEQLYSLAPPGAELIAAAKSTPWKYRDYTTYRYTTFTEVCRTPLRARPCFAAVRAIAHSKQLPTFVVVTRAEREALRLQGDGSYTTVRRMEQAMAAQRFRLAYRNPDVRIYEYTPRD